jgi:uncharacterized protein
VRAKRTFVVISAAGSRRDRSVGTREQASWVEHARFIDRLVEEGFVKMGGPLVDEGGALLVVEAVDEAEVLQRLGADPWYEQGILELESLRRWDVFIGGG